MVCRHRADVVEFPDGTRVLASGWFERTPSDEKPDFGLYLDPMWTPTWPSEHLDWPDFGVPTQHVQADAAIERAWRKAQKGARVEVACIGGHGRSGTVLACMAVLAGIAPDEAVRWVRQAYCERAVQEPSQEYWMQRFAERQASPTPRATPGTPAARATQATKSAQ
jgi:Swiss Army Knife protein, DSP-PTPase phosphatase domain